MQRSILFRHIQSPCLTQKVKQPCGDFGIMKMQLQSFSNGTHKGKGSKYIFHITAAALGITTAWGMYSYYTGKKSLWDAVKFVSASEALQNKTLLAQYSLNDVAAHCSKSTGIWVTYNCGVYDVTDYVDYHPGGDTILMAAGGSLEDYWIKYPVHKNPPVLAQLEKYRIGTLVDCEQPDAVSSVKEKPRTPPSPKNNIPDVDPATYTLKIEAIGGTSTQLSLSSLRNNFPKHTVTAALKCAGNCRSETAEVKHNHWSGARLAEVLKAAGYTENHAGIQQVQFEGLDLAVPGMHYGTSVPFEKAIDPNSNIILAYELNGEPLSKDNGFPIRVLIPGIPAGRQVKWLGRIIIAGNGNDSP